MVEKTSYVRTAQVVATSDIEEFSRAVSSSFVPLNVSASRPSRFRGELRGRRLGEIDVFDSRANQHGVERPQSLASQTPNGKYMLHLQLSGVGVFRQDGREAVLQRGDLVFYDSDRGYSLSMDDHFRNAIIVIPKRLIQLPREQTNELTATKFPSQHEVLGVVTPFIVQLINKLDHFPTHSGLRLARNTIDLITTVIHSKLGGVPAELFDSRSHESRMSEVFAYIEDHLHDPGLNPGKIAEAHFISLRTLHEMFRRENLSVAKWIRDRRLQLSRDDLSSPLHRQVRISSIAARYGFVHAPHFSRAFKDAFGESPAEFRRKSQPFHV